MKFCKVISAAIAACAMAVMVGMSAGASITPVETNYENTSSGTNGKIRAQTQVYKGYDYAPGSGVSVYSYGAKLSILDAYTLEVMSSTKARMSLEGTIYTRANHYNFNRNTNFKEYYNNIDQKWTSSNSNAYVSMTTTTTVNDPAFGYCRYETNGSF